VQQVSSAVERPRSVGHWIVLAASLAAPLGLFAARTLLTPEPQGFGTHEQLGLPACQSMNWFGLPCPGCGVTTSVAWFAHAQVLESFRTQPLGFLIGVLALLSAPLALMQVARGRDLGDGLGRWNRREVWLAFGAYALVAWAYKAVVMLAN